MSKGGRGRGWLNINKNQNNPVPPGNIVTVAKPNIPSVADESLFTDASEYKEIINRVKELNISDDGIKFNQKLRYILENWKQDCKSSEEVEKSFDALYQGCLSDDELASKLVIMISSRSFISQEVHDQNFRLLFLRKLQNDFEGGKVLQKTNPIAFRNCVRMLGEFFSKARLVNGDPFTFMLIPLVNCLEMLLDSPQVSDLQQVAFQFYLNGAAIKTECPDKLNELFNKIRTLLTSDKQISKEGKLWLLLSIELGANKFGVLPIDVFKFYQEQIGGNGMSLFQCSQNILSVQTPEDNKTLENYKSSVNVLQLSTKPEPTQPALEPTVPQVTNSVTNFTPEVVNHTPKEPPKTQNSSNNTGKFGRPILGAGARLNKAKFNNDSSNWRDKDNSSTGGWKKTGWGNNDKNSKGKSKGWEHDDRFENNYS
ncbi:CBP80/20-dependent translation initiation factor-like isoform X1 [Diabrotica virgifera virgifera]|uniref:CBP80/20-dependent translation initiation factor-like isoform X1 n=1 Tax=Diabrotica virgifera virgifera TaxID=50390 RepID=A0A6P7F8F4_DIAVI|nr:CBP80/20-dependent translation initiation factor-like isoform X1 [Diabrotica virgifera virgifera]